MRVAYTPGHASHHVCYLHEESGTAFVGDVAACRIPPSNLIVPPTPPPDIDIEVWEDSIDIVEAWRPERLALTHFGAVEDDVPSTWRRSASACARRPSWPGSCPQDAYEADLQRRIRAQMDAESWARRRSKSCSRPSRPPTSGAASTATGASAPSAKRRPS